VLRSGWLPCAGRAAERRAQLSYVVGDDGVRVQADALAPGDIPAAAGEDLPPYAELRELTAEFDQVVGR
jgi:hypothetical protein